MNTYTVTFVAEPTDDELERNPDAELATLDVTLKSSVTVEDVAAGDWDTHEWLTRFARRRGALGRSWEAVHVTLPDGEIVTVPAGL